MRSPFLRDPNGFGKTGLAFLVAACVWGLTAVGCGTDPIVIDPSSRQAYFDLEAWLSYQDSLLRGSDLLKRVSVNGVEQEARLSGVDWAGELSPFAQANINKPALIGQYAVDTTTAADGSLTVEYRTLDASLRTKRLRVSCGTNCDYGQVREIEIESATESLIADTEQQLRWTPEGFWVTSQQAALLVEPRVLAIEGRVVRP